MTADRKAEVNRTGHGQIGASQKAPGLAVQTGVAVKHVPGPSQAQPILRIVDRKGTSQCRTGADRRAGFKEAAAEGR